MYKKGSQSWIKHLDFMILDIVCLQISLLLAYAVRHNGLFAYRNPLYFHIGIFLVLLDFVVIIFCDTLKNVLKRSYSAELRATIENVVLIELLLALYLFLTQSGYGYSRTVMIVMGIFYFCFSYASRCAWKSVINKRVLDTGKRSLLIVTVSSLLDEVLKDIENNSYGIYHAVEIAVLDKDMVGQQVGSVEIVANRDDVVDYAGREWVDEVFIHYPDDVPFPEAINSQFIEMGVVTHEKLAEASYMKGKKQLVEKMGNFTVLTTSVNYTTSGQLFLKRAMDIAGGLVGCLFTGILFIFLAPAIYHASPGPIFFVQERVGRNGKKFKMYKFRSMVVDADQQKQDLMDQNQMSDDKMFKMDWDPRVIGNRYVNGERKTGIGDFMRRRSLDEFPQFFNVLKGDMSLVGTRPPTVDEWEKYEAHHRVRLAAKPGITGMWQIQGRSKITDFEEVVELDKEYISEWSIWLDIKILFKTIGVVLKKEGSA